MTADISECELTDVKRLSTLTSLPVLPHPPPVNNIHSRWSASPWTTHKSLQVADTVGAGGPPPVLKLTIT